MKSKIFLLAILVFAMRNLCLAQYTKLLDLDNTATGIYPYYGALYSDGTFLYGTTTNGGLNGDGTIFKIKRDGTAFSKLLDFDEAATGSIGESSLISDGTYLYGTAVDGGTSGDGTVFKIKTDGTGFIKLHDFAGEEFGVDPHGSLYDDGVFLYGMTGQGGANGAGTIYKLKKDGSDFSIVFNFEFLGFALTGNTPYGALISDGTYLYGMTVNGGTINQGVVFKIKPDGTGFVKLMDFIDDPNGSWGFGSLVYDGTYLYGMTNNGGEENRGTIFKIKTDGTSYEKLLDMDDSNGAQPLGSLILVGTTLYGMTELGGEDFDAQGNMFSIETDGSNFTTLIDFDGDNGSVPYGTLLYEDGAFFGMTTGGGANGYGVIFRYGDIDESILEIGALQISVYPNPAHGTFHISSVDAQVTGPMQLEMYNVIGKKVYTTQMKNGNAEVDPGHVPAGMYVIKLLQGGNVFVRSIVIN